MKPYFDDGTVSLYLGDCREVLPALGVTADCLIADPPYAETSLEWDRWPDGWLEVAASVSRSMWCFGSLRMYLDRAPEFAAAGWKLSQDVIWEKHNGSGFANDRFKRVHEQPTHWYRGPWSGICHDTPTEIAGRSDIGGAVRSRKQPAHTGVIGERCDYGGESRLMRSVIKVRSMHHNAIHPTEKPVGILDPLISYACPLGGLVVAPFAGSGSDLDAARASGRRAIGVELREPYAEKAARRLSQAVLDFSA